MKPPFSYGFPMVFPWFSHRNPQKSPHLTVARHRRDGTSEAVAGDDHVLTSGASRGFQKTAAATWFISSNCGKISSLTVKQYLYVYIYISCQLFF